MKKLSICMIARDEEETIERCINSIKPIASEIIVLDTGSTDKTKEKVKALGGILIEDVWENNFSKIRNKSIEKATGDWIFIIDCDEELEEESLEKIKSIIEDDEKEGYYLVIKNIIKGKVYNEAPVFRLFKNNKKYKYIGKIHEQIVDSIIKNNSKEAIGREEVFIKHYGYDEKINISKDKSNRNLALLLSYEEKDKNGYYYYALANEYNKIGKNEEAMQNYLKADEITINLNKSDENYYPSLILNLTKLLYKEGKFIEIADLIDEKISLLEDFKDLYFFRFLALNNLEKLTEAKEALEKYLDLKENPKRYPVINYGNEKILRRVLLTL